MLYAMHAAHRMTLEPLHLLAEASQMLLQPFAAIPAIRPAQASLEMLSRMTRDYGKPTFDLDQPERVIQQTPFARLLRFDARAHVENPVLWFVAAPLSGHHATLLRHTVDALLDHGDVVITDWLDARTIPAEAGSFGIDDYVDHLIRFMAQAAAEGTRPLSAIAVCQPGPPMVAAMSVMARDGLPGTPSSLSIISAPMDPAAAPTQVTELAAQHSMAWFERNVIYPVPLTEPGRGRRVYPGFLQLAGFMSMNPERHMEKQQNVFFDRLAGNHDQADRVVEFYDEYWSVLDLPAEFYLQTIDQVFQRRTLATGQATYRDTAIDPSIVQDLALQTVEAGADDVCAPGQTVAAHRILAGLPEDKRNHFVADGVGHYGGFSGTRFRKNILPRMVAFATQHAA
ncbi:hypothetical protein CKO28_01690 [Rhodovibrio sodomensis]|uniref:PHB de-polymerase C-terminal domain-containing protein n=1 Tax=Rhodovibrio sodomensis TaxID=1088 RepID=A0ABS1DBG1_9PROT|nr:polyhydroxyalkanoate depolymerase [Rhodovibrio sodomensis]MBK1666755.1 hypothetical protein [Rhodovibrio sodomensis]